MVYNRYNKIMKYNCSECVFTTQSKSNYDAHMNSSKHNINVLTIRLRIMNIEEDSTIYKQCINTIKTSKNKTIFDFCPYCLKCMQKKSVKIHIDKHCNIKKQVDLDEKCENQEIEIKNLTGEIQNLKYENLAKEVKMLKEHNEVLVKVVDSTIKTNKKSMSLLTYLIKNNRNAPPLKNIELSQIEEMLHADVTGSIAEKLIHTHRQKTFPDYIGNKIISIYKKENPEEQSFWTTDANRLNYVVKQIKKNINDENADSDDDDGDYNSNSNNNDNDNSEQLPICDSAWMRDTKGVIITQNIIIPIMKHIEPILKTYVANLTKHELENCHIDEIHKKHDRAFSASDLLYILNRRDTYDKILKHVAPHFGFTCDK